MFEAINDYVILQPVEAKTESGIVLTQGDESKVRSYKVVSTTKDTETLLGREIKAHKGMVSDLGEGYYSVLVDEIRAVRSE